MSLDVCLRLDYHHTPIGCQEIRRVCFPSCLYPSLVPRLWRKLSPYCLPERYPCPYRRNPCKGIIMQCLKCQRPMVTNTPFYNWYLCTPCNVFARVESEDYIRVWPNGNKSGSFVISIGVLITYGEKQLIEKISSNTGIDSKG